MNQLINKLNYQAELKDWGLATSQLKEYARVAKTH